MTTSTPSEGHGRDKPCGEDASVQNRASTPQGIHHTHGAAGDIPRQQSQPPADKVRGPARTGVSRGPQKDGSLLSWRIVDNNSSVVNPRNIWYANAVLHMLHQARSREGLITGLGNLNGSLTQAARSNQAVNIARDPAWSYVWPGWQRPTRQHDAAEFLQHLCQRTACAALQGGWEARRHEEGAYAILDE